MNHKSVRFSRSNHADFIADLRKSVNNYFDTKDISVYANANMVLKTVFMFALFFVPYFLMIFGVVTNNYLVLLMWVLMGFGTAGIGLSVMHDANHGAYSKNKYVNKYLSYVMNMVGASSFNWKIQHNILHHSYTNIEGMDEDIDPGKLMRLSPHAPLLKVHKHQHIYGWFLYGMMTFLWLTTKDFRQLYRYKQMGLLKSQKRTYNGVLIETIISKILYYGYALVIPMVFIQAPWWIIFIGFFIMHYITGLSLGLIFQPAHVMPSADYPMPDETGNMENNWAVHQLFTTTNFAPKSKLFSWYVGGLNFQIEHHLFPNICHVHYKNIAKIVEAKAREFGLPYNSEKTFYSALVKHGQMLKKLGREPLVA
ncbi:linoleoyl-CoA desaturase [Roseivirga pacifica]|uniref:Linoleoyl-CoA desaturase n=1 Tax=Roseivirga pacifica TaxID=1267423 RepID=A0A1I0NSF8_9BACT|nr:acyl-CoA desaturase [Roseivirga pacifica]RKQ51419.1 linoleoyl-CoA desaturase [Roseivirga pacifica]SEW04478.1 linoleoyl-CoA desaturase [Roseivirga pacifica]